MADPNRVGPLFRHRLGNIARAPPEIRKLLEDAKRVIETWMGERGDPLDQVPTWRHLWHAGVVHIFTGGEYLSYEQTPSFTVARAAKPNPSTLGGLKNWRGAFDLPDGAEEVLPIATAGFGFAQAGDNQEYALFAWKADGGVTLISNSANAVNTDTASKFCIYDAGSGIAIKNRLGSTLTIRYDLNYS